MGGKEISKRREKSRGWGADSPPGREARQTPGEGGGARVNQEQEKGAESHLAGQRRSRAWEGGEQRRGAQRRSGGTGAKAGGGNQLQEKNY